MSSKGLSGVFHRGYERLVAGGERKARRTIAPYLLSRSDDEIHALGYSRSTIESWVRNRSDF